MTEQAMRSPLSRASKAFTLIELMISVSIMVMLLASGSVAYLRYLNKQNLYQSGSAIEEMVKNARSKAQTGYLGSEEIGFCDRLNSVEVLSSIDASSQVSLTAQLHCMNEGIIVFDTYTANRGVTLNRNFKVSFLPISGSLVYIAGSQVASGSATLAYDDNEVVLNFDQGGNVDVQYQ